MVASISALKQKKPRRWQDVQRQNRKKYPVSGQTTFLDRVGQVAHSYNSNTKCIATDVKFPPNTFYLGDGVDFGSIRDINPYFKLNINGIDINTWQTGSTFGNAVFKCPEAPDALPVTNTTSQQSHKAGEFIVNGDTIWLCVKDAPVGTAYTNTKYFETRDHVSREDVNGIELFLVEIGEGPGKIPVVYPYGSTQFSGQTYDGVALSNDVMPSGYSAYGEWDDTTRGYGIHWSNASAVERDSFINNEENNIFVEDGKYYQWQFRFRSIAGIGNNWEFLNDEMTNRDVDNNELRQGGGRYVIPQGKKVTPTRIGDLPADRIGYYSSSFSPNAHSHDRLSWLAQSDAGDKSLECAVDGHCYFYVVATTTRFNKGTYHPYRNPMGTAHYSGGSEAGRAIDDRKLWSNSTGDRKLQRHKADLFDLATGFGAGEGGCKSTYPNSGGISSIFDLDTGDVIVSNRPDAIIAHDFIWPGCINNLLNKATPFDLDIIESMYNFSQVLGTNSSLHRGWEPLKKMRFEGVVTPANATVSFSGAMNSTYFKIPQGTLRSRKHFGGIDVLSIQHGSSSYYTAVCGYVTKGGKVYEANMYKPYDSSEDVVHLSPRYGDVVDEINALSGNIEFISYEQSDIYLSQQPVMCIMSTPEKFGAVCDMHDSDHLLGGDWSDQYPDGTEARYYQMNRVAIDWYHAYYSDNNGINWAISAISDNYSTRHNAWYRSVSAGEFFMRFYLTAANVFIDVGRGDLRSHDGKLSHLYAQSAGGVIQRRCIGEWAVGVISTAAVGGDLEETQGTPLTNWTISPYGNYDQFFPHNAQEVEHDPLKLYHNTDGGSGDHTSGCKYYALHTDRDDNRIYLTLIVNEVIADLDRERPGEGDALIVDSTTFNSWQANNFYKVRNGPFVGSWYCVSSSSSRLDDTSSFSRDSRGRLLDLAGNITFIPWSGSGWGDDGKFQTPEHMGSKIDLNGNAVRTATVRTRMPIGYIFD